LRYALQLRRSPSITALNGFARLLRGEMDCALFRSSGDQSSSTFRYINGASFFMDGETLCFEISANAFLWKMVRSIVGSLLAYEAEALSPSRVLDYLKSGDRRLAGPTAPPHGLTLWRVEY
jgi:tRNA pseudouridine38-40 synthase